MKLPVFLLLLLSCVLGHAAAPAPPVEDLGAAKVRMAQRLASLGQFKAKGELGENNHGWVELLRGGSVEAGDVMAGENRDRRMIYTAIAKQAGASVDQVGRSQGRQIAADSVPGTWLQRDDGGWYKK